MPTECDPQTVKRKSLSDKPERIAFVPDEEVGYWNLICKI